MEDDVIAGASDEFMIYLMCAFCFRSMRIVPTAQGML
jgi:hypothetical protein